MEGAIPTPEACAEGIVREVSREVRTPCVKRRASTSAAGAAGAEKVTPPGRECPPSTPGSRLGRGRKGEAALFRRVEEEREQQALAVTIFNPK